MTDLNNRPGGPNLIVTAKTAHKVHFLDAATLTMQATIDMPGSTHELALSADGRTAYGTVYGDGVFAKRVNPDRRIVVIDLPSQSLTRVIDLGAVYAPHGVMMDEQGTLWSSGELGNAVLAIDPATDKVEKIDVGNTAHWVAVSHATGKVFASVKSDYLVAIDAARRAVIDRIALPHVVEGLAVSPDGATVYACAQDAAEFYAIDARTPCGHPHGADRRRQSGEEADAPRAGLARQQLCRCVVEPGCPCRDLRRRKPQADRVDPDQEIAHGLRLRAGRRARLCLLPRRRRGVRVRAGDRPGDAHLPDRGGLRVHRGVLTLEPTHGTRFRVEMAGSENASL